MDLKEAFKTAHEGDLIYCESKETFKIEFQKEFINNFLIPGIYVLSDNWQIIPDKKEPVSAQKFVEKYKRQSSYNDWNDYDLIRVFQASEENRDLLYEDLVDATKRYVTIAGELAGSVSLTDIRKLMGKALDKINRYKEKNGNN